MSSDDRLAPVIPLFEQVERHEERSTWLDGPASGTVSPRPERIPVESEEEATACRRRNAENDLTKRLRRRSLSMREARDILLGDGLDEGEAETVLARFGGLGYLDDAALAEQLVHTAARKGEGRQAIAHLLARRGIDAEVSEHATAILRDDADRAVDVARRRAASLATLPPEVALRRLSGQLQRRGYPAGTALRAAQAALREAGTDPF